MQPNLPQPTEIAPGITLDAKVASGKPVLKGTRVTVEFVLGQLAAGVSREELMRELSITDEGISAALAYAAERMSEEETRALGS
jgi:uncharacterized protein (DUF433 family)